MPVHVGLLDPADAVLQTGRARAPPTAGPGSAGRAGTAGTRAAVRRRSSHRAGEGELIPQLRQAGDLGDAPGLRAVGQVAVGQDDHRGAVLGRDPHRLERDLEAVGRGGRGQHRDRRLAVPAEQRHQQVGLLGLGRHAGGRPGPLDVADDQRQFHRDGQADRLGLERHARARTCCVTPSAPPNDAPSAAPIAADLVFGLEGADPEPLELGQLVQDVRGRRDRVGAEEQRQAGPPGRGDQAVGERACCR